MQNIIIDIIPIVISLFALIFSVQIGKKQVEISQQQADAQNKVELYLMADCRIYRDAEGKMPDKKVPAIFVRNIGGNIIYLENYIFNGRKYDVGKHVIPPVSTYQEALYSIELPTDGTTHVSLEIKFLDWKSQKWELTGYADLRNGIWEITYSPSKRIAET